MQQQNADYLHSPSVEELAAIRTSPGKTSDGKPFDWYVKQKLDAGEWRLECIRPEVLGLDMPIEIYRGVRKTGSVKPWPQSDDEEAYCPAHWADLAIGCGACGLRCKACFLIMTHRIKCDPARHLVYENHHDFERAVRRWLPRPNRRNLGLGTDSSDSLLYEGVTGHARRLIPIFASADTNPHGSKLILLTKSTNVHYLEGLPTKNVLLTFSLNPEAIADLWEGKLSDGTRVMPSIEARLAAALRGQHMGFEVRWRIDPIIPVEGRREFYADFFSLAAHNGHQPTRVTLGTYRETQRCLLTFAKRWGLPPLEWKPSQLHKDGAHYHLDREQRIEIYRFMARAIEDAWQPHCRPPVVALCKEPRSIRREVGLDHDMCNCG